MNRLVNRLTNR